MVGLNANAAGWGGASTAGRLDLVTGATGTRWLREEIDWATVEPQPGVFDFSYYDHFMQLAAQRGLHILAVLYDIPAWAGPAYNSIPSDPTAFAQYVAAVVVRYGTNGTFWAQNPSLNGSAITAWELWNEPYLGSDIHHDWSSFVQPAFIYSYGDGSNPASTQGGYGLTYLSGTPKPALAIFHSQAVASAG